MLNLDEIYQKTWTDGTYFPPGFPPSITINFNGSAVYVFNIIPNTLPAFTLANISFSIDGEPVGVFFHSPDASSMILYHQLVYHNATLNNGPHTLVMAPVGNDSLVLFDYLVYTAQGNDTTPSGSSPSIRQSSSSSSFTSTSTQASYYPAPTSSSHTPAPVSSTVGAVLGALGLLVVVVGGYLLYRSCARSRDTKISTFEIKHGQTAGGSKHGPHTGEDRCHPHAGLLPPPSSETPFSHIPGHIDIAPGRRTESCSLVVPCDVSAPETLPPGVVADTSPASHCHGVSAAPEWPPNSPRREEITRRLERLQCTRSALPSQTPSEFRHPCSEVGSDGGTAAAMRDLEAEIVQLRGVLAAMNVQFGDGGHSGFPGEPLPAYAE